MCRNGDFGKTDPERQSERYTGNQTDTNIKTQIIHRQSDRYKHKDTKTQINQLRHKDSDQSVKTQRHRSINQSKIQTN